MAQVFDPEKLVKDMAHLLVEGLNKANQTPRRLASTAAHVDTEILDTHYATYKPVLTPIGLYGTDIENRSEVPQEFRFSRSETHKDSFSWELSQGLELGAKTEIEVGLPKIAGGKVELSAKLSLGAKEGHSEEVSQTWSVDMPIKVPPRSKVRATLQLEQRRFRADLIVTCKVAGTYEIRLVPTGEAGVTGWGGPFYGVIDYLKHRGKDMSGWRTEGIDDLAFFEGRFLFEAVQGIRSQVVIDQYDLDGKLIRHNAPATEFR